ncbi:MAG: hypothetical protein BWX70_02751 [Verrucomicrobia bacterium ADurb.Bin070]|nr:MAG: hypothetical protein BWX70_02751 [Verrucomicrobia bacterium ADurb.Bin070]
MLNSTQIRVAKDYVTVHGYSAQVCRLHNTSSVSIDYSLNSGAAVTVAAGGYETINVRSSTSEVRLKRTDGTNTAVDVIIEWGLTVDEAYEQSLLAIDSATVRISVGPGRDYATFDSAIAAIAALGTAAVIDLDPSVAYTSAGGSLPTVPICIYGNGAVITTSSAITVTASCRAYDLNVVGNVIYAGASTDRYFITGGSHVGNVTLTTGLLHDDGSSLLSGLVTINGGTFECISTEITSQILHTDGRLLMQNFNVNATSDTAMITSTATSTTSAIALVNGHITNSGTGTALDISSNTQTAAGANALVNVSLTTSEAASAVGGTAVCQIANCNYTKVPTGSGWTKSNWNIS